MQVRLSYGLQIRRGTQSTCCSGDIAVQSYTHRERICEGSIRQAAGIRSVKIFSQLHQRVHASLMLLLVKSCSS